MKRWLEGKIAIVTGAGRGIGQATAQLLATEGAQVVVTDVDLGPVAATATAIRALGEVAYPLVGDITSPAFPQQLMDTTRDVFGSLDILVNNAGYTWRHQLSEGLLRRGLRRWRVGAGGWTREHGTSRARGLPSEAS